MRLVRKLTEHALSDGVVSVTLQRAACSVTPEQPMPAEDFLSVVEKIAGACGVSHIMLRLIASLRAEGRVAPDLL